MELLKHVVAVAKPGALVVTTDLLRGVHGPEFERAKVLMDINMMANCKSGARERDVNTYMALFEDAGI